MAHTSIRLPRIPPVVPTIWPQPFNDSTGVFEPKYDGFRGMVYLSAGGGCTIYSKRGNRFSRFPELEKRLCSAFPRRDLVLDGEIVAFDDDGRVSFWDLMHGEGILGYVAFDLLWYRGRDLRTLPLLERNKRLTRLIPEQDGTLCSVLVIEEHGQELFEAVCGSDLEGIVAKRGADAYNLRTRWLKIKNPTYSQAQRRRELFDRWGSRDEPQTIASG